MKILALVSILAAALVVGLGGAPARASHAATPSKVTVVMHDPGCHWLSAGGKLSRTLSVRGAAQVLNLDEAALIVKSAKSVQHVAVGHTITLSKGSYLITMVKQAPDDNHLRLTVR